MALTPAQRQENKRSKKTSLGLVRVEIYIKPEFRHDAKQMELKWRENRS
jgi:hypothetical protein